MSAVAAPEPTPTPVTARSESRAARSERLRLLLRTPTVLIGVLVIGFWVFCALFPGIVAPYNPIFDNQLPTNEPPSWAYPFGTDTNGRDVFSRVLAGSRSVLLIAPAAVIIGTVLGTTLGLITGYFRGVVDDVTGRFIDAVLALPLIVTAILIVTAVGSSARWVVALTIGLIFTPVISRTVRAAVLAEAELDYVQAARLRGERSPYIMFSEILPNVLAPIVVEFTVRLGYAIFAVATLTFIGFGVQPPSPDWAAQINQYYTFIDPYWWMTLFPALAIASLVVSVNLVADGIREVYER
jgi:peptide/nickel transport system permease protein